MAEFWPSFIVLALIGKEMIPMLTVEIISAAS